MKGVRFWLSVTMVVYALYLLITDQGMLALFNLGVAIWIKPSEEWSE
jgi:hypothetical protein